MRERMLRNLDKSQRTRTFFKSTLASLVEELERRSTQLLVCLEQLEISSLAVGMEDLMHCYEQYVELRRLLVQCSHLSKQLEKKQLRDLLGMNSGGDWLATLQARLAQSD